LAKNSVDGGATKRWRGGRPKEVTMSQPTVPQSLRAFEMVDDPRRVHPTTLHNLMDIIALTILGTLSSAENWVEIEWWAKSKASWLKTVLPLKHGIPSHDTMSRVFSMLDPDQMAEAFTRWTALLAGHIHGVVALDGKTVRRSMDTADGRGPIHIVSAFAARSRLVLSQVKVAKKSNEIVALPQIIKLLDLTDCVATVDAMGCQVDVAKAVRQQHGDYMLAIKDNQPTLLRETQELFDWALAKDRPADQSAAWVQSETVDGEHGRIEHRRCVGTAQLEGLSAVDRWPAVGSLWRVESERSIGGKTTLEHRYYISSLPARNDADAARANDVIRTHWSVENQLHWVLDVAMAEDINRSRQGHSAANLALMRKFVLNLLRLDKGSKGGVKTRQKRAGWDHDYMLHLLSLATG
jgi:predicted transposase YbfD/YdcC